MYLNRMHNKSILLDLVYPPNLGKDIFLPAKGLGSSFMLLDVAGGLFDQADAQLVTGFVVVGPVDQAVLADDETFQARVLPGGFTHLERQVVTGPLPGGVANFTAKHIAGQALLVLAGGDCNGRNGVGMIDVPVR